MPKNTLQTIESSGRTVLPVSAQDTAILDVIGAQGIALMIAAGRTYAEIAQTLGVTRGSVATWVYNLPDEERAIITEAGRASAEELIDQAGDILNELANRGGRIDDRGRYFADLSGPEVQLAIARAQHVRTKAGQRNHAYRDKAPAPDVAPAGSGAAAPVHFVLTIAGRDAPAGVTVEGSAERIADTDGAHDPA